MCQAIPEAPYRFSAHEVGTILYPYIVDRTIKIRKIKQFAHKASVVEPQCIFKLTVFSLSIFI